MAKKLEPVIELKNVTKKFKTIYANKNVSFSIYKGQNIGIIGANGAGKTTLVEQLVGIKKPTSGKIVYNYKYDRVPQEKIGIQFQDSSYPPGLTVKDIIEFSLEVYGLSINPQYLKAMLEKFRITQFYKKAANSLSGGQLQKLNVLLAIIHNPEVIILDEISTGLDVSTREDILEHVKGIADDPNKTTILVSHHMNEIEMFCERVIVLAHGGVVADKRIDDLVKEYGNLDEYMRKVLLEYE